MQPISEAVYQKHLTSSALALIPFGEWVTRLNACVVDTREANIRRVVSFHQKDPFWGENKSSGL